MPVYYQGLGSEEILDQIFITLRTALNGAIGQQEDDWNARDEARADAMGIDYVPIGVEEVPPDNFHVGSIPSFVQSEDRVVNYPMVVVAPGRTVPDAEDARTDHYRVYNNAVAVHSFARANPQEGAEVAYRRAMRMAEAVHIVVHTHPGVRRAVRGVSGPVLVERSEPWYFPPEDGHGEDWLWMAVMHQYQVKNYSMTPQEV